MKIKVSETTPLQLDWLVAKCEFIGPDFDDEYILAYVLDTGDDFVFRPSTDWAQGGPIIEREHINLSSLVGCAWRAAICPRFDPPYGIQYGKFALEAAMRCYVASKLGDEVEVPDELA